MIMANHLKDRKSLPEIINAVYVIARAVEIKVESKKTLRKLKKIEREKQMKNK